MTITEPSWSDIVHDYIIKYSDRIKKTTQPLRDHFGIGYFTYHHIDGEGRYTVLVDRPDWAEYYVSEKIFLNDPYLRHPQVYQPGMSLMGTHGSEEYKKTVFPAGKRILNMDLAVILIQKRADCVEFFGFAGGQETSCLEKLYLNHPQLLKSFASHFKKELTPILTSMEPSSLLNLKGADFLCPESIHPQLSSSCHLNYLQDIGKRVEMEKVQQLSVRERQCLKLLVEEKSAKETAFILGLSCRTIEFYFENIKKKLACWNKQEVLIIARTLEDLGLLP